MGYTETKNSGENTLTKALVIDLRDEGAYAYGKIGDALNIPCRDFSRRKGELPKDRPILLYCQTGTKSKALAASLKEEGYDASYLEGGYVRWVIESPWQGTLERVETGIRKKFHKELWTKFAKAVTEYRLVEEGDTIAVCISGGKDSMLMAKLFQELKRHDKFPFALKFLVMDPGYSAENRKIIEKNCALLNIPAEIFESDIFESVFTVEKSPCYLCARMRRGTLYAKAQSLGCNKIALGHHFDDVIETILMGMLYGGQVQTMMPKLYSTNFKGMQLIRPLYYVREEDIRRWRDDNDLHFIQCACKFTEAAAADLERQESSSKRLEIKNLIKTLKRTNPQVENNIFKSVQNVNLSTVIAYKDKEGVHHFLDRYKEEL